MRWRRTKVLAALALGAALTAPVAPGSAAAPDSTGPDLMTGTGGAPPWSSGGTTPAAARPFGMVQLGPDTTADPMSATGGGTPSATASGYAADDPHLRGFSPTHLSGAGCRAFGDVPVLPWTGPLPAHPSTATVPLDRTGERAGPGWHRTRLGNGVTATLAADDRSGLAAYRFPRGASPWLLVKADGSLAGTRSTRVRLPSRRDVVVRATSGGFCGSSTTYDVHVRLRLDQPAAAVRRWPGGVALRFDASRGRTVRAQVAVSFVDAAGARRNLESDDPGWSVERLRAEATRAWTTELERVTATGSTAEQRTTLRSALYHVLLHPTTVSDADGRYPGFDGRVHRVAAGHRRYTAATAWDAYRTHTPLLAWLRPDVASDLVASLLAAAREGGWMPRWPLVAQDTLVMSGDSAAPLAAAAHAFGARSYDVGAVAAQLVRQARVATPARPDLATYLDLGWVPGDASTSLEHAVDDFAVSRLAAAVGRDRDAADLRARSGWWRHLLDPDRRVLAPRAADGAFPGPGWDPAACCAGFQEGTAAQYTWSVPHDMGGLLAALGTRAEVLGRLDDLHAELNAGAGAHAWLGNQPSLLTPWAHLWLGEPARSQDVVARALDELWRPGPRGLPGNDDLGGLSAWYVWAALGLQPLVPGTDVTALGRPLFTEVVVRPRSGAPTRLVRVGDARHVAGVTVDGRAHGSSWLRMGPTRPRTVVVTTTDDGRPAWATGPGDVPPSYGG
ncbi:GH92 family glycosyl hydrolase [Nocardioides sp. SOB77]|uniref:GH92 family glycosyl hydrolase n=1 Tax=Nocardioides oceani TaxID=3058369 RepID=A0ABT8FDL1_9ACTN|nr:GH92 family glycosyl hydrolase [Nocardioides oceani]MDN4172773.1 GH92 family glycosyl hydrolase [Nocardioides oceani]